MTPTELASHVRSLDRAAELVDAIDSPDLQDVRGWDLSRWRYDLIPWGVRFHFQGPKSHEPVEVMVVAVEAGGPPVEPLLESGKIIA